MPSPRPIPHDDPGLGGASVTVTRFEGHASHGAVLGHAPVTHTYAALGFYTGGGARMEVGGEWTLREGDVLLLPAGAPHRMLETANPVFWGMACCHPPLLAPFERVRDGASAVVHIPAARHDYLDGLFCELERIGREAQDPHDTFDAVQRSLLTLILAEVDRASRADGAHPGTGGGVVVDALRFIERNCLKPLTLGDIAAAVRRTPTYVTTALKQATGRSAVQWIVSGRMAEARRLLLHSDERIDVVSERVGYADATHFIRMFRREHGATPAAWRATQARVRARRSAGDPS